MTQIGGPIVLMAVGMLLWVAAAHVDKAAALEEQRFMGVLILIVLGIGCVVAGVTWLLAINEELATLPPAPFLREGSKWRCGTVTVGW